MPITKRPAKIAAEKKPKFDIYKFLETRPLSYSALNAFSDEQWGSPEKWYQTYIKGIRQTSKALEFGSMVDKKLQNDPKFLPEVERFPKKQHELRAILEIGKRKIPLIGFADGWDPNPKRYRLKDDKTGKNPWTQKKADETEQFTFYALGLYLIDKIRPEDIEFQIDWIPTYERADLSIDFVRPIKHQTFKTRRTMPQVIKLCAKIDKTLKQMEAYVNNRS